MKNDLFGVDIKHPWKGIFRYALPILLSALLQQFYNTVDLYILGSYDTQSAMAAVGACGFLVALITTFATGLSAGVSVIVSSNVNSEECKDMSNYIFSGFIVNVVMGFVMALVGYFVSPYILEKLIGLSGNLLIQAQEYMRICSVGIVFIFLYNFFVGVLRGLGNSKSPLYFLAVSAIFNIVLDIINVKFLNLSVNGVAIATVIAQIIALIVTVVYVCIKYSNIINDIQKKNSEFNKKSIVEVLKVGVPLSVQGIVINLGYMIVQNTVNSFGESMTASYSVASKLEMYLLMPFIAFSQAMIIYVGYLLGSGEKSFVKNIIVKLRKVYFVAGVVISIIAFLTAPMLAGIFHLGLEETSIFVRHFRMIAFDILIYVLYSPVIAYFGGAKKTQFMLLCSSVEMAGRIISINVFKLFIGEQAVWFSEAIPWAVVCIMMNVLYYFSMKAKK